MEYIFILPIILYKKQDLIIMNGDILIELYLKDLVSGDKQLKYLDIKEKHTVIHPN